MTDKNLLLLSLIEKEIPSDEICNTLNISPKQLKRRIEEIKYSGFNIDRKYNYDGSSNYYINREILNNLNSNRVTINSSNTDEFRFLAISDTHYGHKKGNMDYAKLVYEYSAKNNIHIIFHCGDLLEGVFQSKLNHLEQVNYFLENFPSDPNILMFVILGNHEEEFVKDSGLNLNTLINKERDDLISLGYGESLISVFNNNIFISHKGRFTEEYGLKLKGHSHRYKFLIEVTGPVIVLPTLSDYLHTTDYPGAVDLSISLDSNKEFNKLEAKHLTINENNIRETSHVEYPFKRMPKVRKMK